jgi:hypothetical protein
MAHRPISAHLFTLNGNVLTTGGSKNLAKGQFTIVNTAVPTVNGAAVVADFAGLSAKTIYEIRLGKSKVPTSRTNSNSKPYSTGAFKATDITDVRVNFPKHIKQVFDDLIVGYDGISAGTKISLLEDQTTLMDITLSGENISYFTGGSNKHVIKIHFGREVGDTDKDVIERAVARLKKETFPGGMPITDAISIKVVNSDNLPLAGTPYVFSTLVLTDTGDSNSIGLVQAQYPLYRVELTGRDGLDSTYTILHPASVTLANYVSSTKSYIKDCADCAAGYALLSEGGVIYAVSIEDEGADLTTTVDDLPGFVTGSVVKKGQNGDNPSRGEYLVVTDNALTSAEITAFATTAGVKSTALITLIGTVKDVCYNSTTTSTAWVNGNTCYASTESYKIQLKDSDCDGSKLTELQAYYPSLVIEEGLASGNATQAVTLTGTSGTANIAVNGVNYLATFATDLTTTAANFVTAHAAAILTATGAVVTANAGVLTFTDLAEGFPVITITNATTNLAGTVGAVDFVTTATTGGCQRVYSTTVVTDVQCDECSDIFVQGFTSEAPGDFDFHSWEKIEEPVDADAKMGIRLTGKPLVIMPTDISVDQVPYIETSATINVSGGYVEEVNFSFDPIFDDIFTVTRLSRKQDRDSLGYFLLPLERESKAFFDGELPHENNMYAKQVLGEESVIKFDKQYIQYAITVQDSKSSQSMGRHSDIAFEYSIWVELGQQTAIEAYINKLAVKAGLDPVQAVAN